MEMIYEQHFYMQNALTHPFSWEVQSHEMNLELPKTHYLSIYLAI